MSYKQLLDPKGFAKEKTKKRNPYYGPQQSRKAAASEPSAPKSSPLKFDPKALLDPKTAAGKSKPSSTIAKDMEDSKPPPTTSAEDVDSQPGMGDLIGRLNNLKNREAPLPSKRKSEGLADGESDEEERKKTKSTFAGTGKGGVIGEYLKAEREKGAAESGPNTEPIDLTNDDDGDEDVVMLWESYGADNKEVCLGMLHSQAIAWLIPNTQKFAASKMGKGFWPQMRINYRRSAARNNIIELFSKKGATGSIGEKFGNLDGKLAAVLCPLLDGNDVSKMRLKMYLDAFEKRPGEFPGLKTSRSLKVRIILYAPRGKAQTIGRFLSQKQLFLSYPFQIEPGVGYENPHEPKNFGPVKAQGRSTSAATFVTRTQEEILRETSDMFDSLVKSEDLPEKELSENIILTPLMSHQKQALQFLTDHERGTDELVEEDEAFSLWKPKDEAKGRVWYNIITNHQVSNKPVPSRGGILADAMGLGKTLSILALIAETRDEARAFGEEEPPLEEEQLQRNCKATLIICPKSVMANWHEQIKAHTKTKSLKVYSYHGPGRTQDLDELAQYNVILAPYQTAASEFSDSRAKRSALASINWFRVVLDEAHMIRNPTTHVSKACCKLAAQRRWAVTGTPVQNRLDDLGALIKFLRIKPFDEGNAWSQFIIAPFRVASEHVITHLRLLVDSITLRRMKDRIGLTERKQIRERLNFSDEEMAIYSRFAKESNRQLRLMMMDGGQLRGKSYAHVLKSLGRLRAICAHGREMLSEDDQKELDGLTAATAIDLGDEPTDEPDGSFVSEKHAYDTFFMMMESAVDICTGCGREIGDRKDSGDADVPELSEDSDSESQSSSETDGDTLCYLTPCFHLLCPTCKDTYLDQTQPKLTEDHYHICIHCEQYVRWGLFELTRMGLKNMLDSRSNKGKKGKQAKWDESTYSGPHTKVKALLQDLQASEQETAALAPEEPPIRSVVFSGWTTYLDLIEYALDENQIGYVRLDGSMSVKARSAVLQTFSSDPTITVLLVSIKAGGQGLNFIAANKVYMMEPQFNPGVESQAIDRVHRLGQKRDVVIKHYIMKESVEEKILALQEKKEKLATLSMEKKLSRSEEARRRMEELKDLFK